MNKKILISIALLLTAAVASAAPKKKSDVKTYKVKPRFELITDRNFHLGGSNIAGIRCDSVTISEATIGGSYSFGEGRSTSMAPKTWTVGASAASITHLERFSMYGRFSFSHTAGYGMTGSMFVNPGRYPIDAMEFTPGEKALQNYAFTGGISVDITQSIRLGARVDCSASNYVKYKDLRYTNFILDLSLRPGVQWHQGPWSGGLSLAIERNTETVTAEQIGESVNNYQAFLNKGLFYGIQQQWDGGATHLNESGISGLPVMEVAYGVAAQFGFKNLYADLAYLHGNGKIGEKDAIWFTFPTDRLNLILGWQKQTDSGLLHIVRLGGEYKHTLLNEASLEYVTVGGVTTRSTIGSNRILNRDNYELCPSWEAIMLGKYDVKVDFRYRSELSVATIDYPSIAEQTLNTLRLNASFNYHCIPSVMVGAGVWGGKGFLSDSMRSLEGAPAATSEPFRQMEQFSAWKEYNTTLYGGVSATLRYIFKNNLYLRGDFSSEFLLHSYRIQAGVSCGYNF